MYQILTVVEVMNNENKETIVRDIAESLQKIEPNIDSNNVNSSIRHYRRNGLISRKHNPIDALLNMSFQILG